MTPFLQAGDNARLVVVEREDYVGKDLVRTDANGRPIMAIHAVREDNHPRGAGDDTWIFAPTAIVNGGE